MKAGGGSPQAGDFLPEDAEGAHRLWKEFSAIPEVCTSSSFGKARFSLLIVLPCTAILNNIGC